MPRQSVTAEIYAEYPLVVLSRDGKREVARLTVDADGNYRTKLPPGDYVLDVQGRARKHLRGRPQLFTIASNRTVRVDMVRVTQSEKKTKKKRPKYLTFSF
jgi:hypothetical protein